MENVPYSQIQKGTFMIATPDIEAGIFFRGVVLVCEHNPNGSFGLVINKSLELELPEEILNVHNLANGVDLAQFERARCGAAKAYIQRGVADSAQGYTRMTHRRTTQLKICIRLSCSQSQICVWLGRGSGEPR